MKSWSHGNINVYKGFSLLAIGLTMMPHCTTEDDSCLLHTHARENNSLGVPCCRFTGFTHSTKTQTQLCQSPITKQTQGINTRLLITITKPHNHGGRVHTQAEARCNGVHTKRNNQVDPLHPELAPLPPHMDTLVYTCVSAHTLGLCIQVHTSKQPTIWHTATGHHQ